MRQQWLKWVAIRQFFQTGKFLRTQEKPSEIWNGFQGTMTINYVHHLHITFEECDKEKWEKTKFEISKQISKSSTEEPRIHSSNSASLCGQTDKLTKRYKQQPNHVWTLSTSKRRGQVEVVTLRHALPSSGLECPFQHPHAWADIWKGQGRNCTFLAWRC